MGKYKGDKVEDRFEKMAYQMSQRYGWIERQGSSICSIPVDMPVD